MKTNPSKLLLALTMCFGIAAAHAEGNNGNKDNSQRKDTSSKSTNVQSADSCSSVILATECGPVQKTTCTTNGSSASASIDAAQKNKDAERHKDDGKDRGDGKDHSEKDHSSNDKHRNRDQSKDDGDDNAKKPYGYHWEQKNDSGVAQRKVTVCHREGGVRTTVDVDDDGHYHGHDNDPLDTEGNCEDQDDKSGKHTDNKNSGRDVVNIHKDAVCGAPIVYQVPDTKKHHKESEHASNGDYNDSHKHVSGQDDKDERGYAIDTNKHRAGYRWVHDNDGNAATTNDRQRKVVICHRMGNARVTLDVDDDGWYHGHSKHPMDTEGRCEDQNDSTGKHTDAANSGKKTVPLATEAACAPNSAAATTTASPACTNAGGLTTVLGKLGANTPGVTVTPIVNGSRPSRGGVRNMR